MNGITAIMKKEMRSYFHSPVAYIFIGLFLAIMGIIFYAFVGIYQQYAYQARFGQAGGISLERLVSQLFQNMAFVMTFMTPAFAMRLFAEERRQQTFELLFTAPIRGWELVLGKFFSAFGVIVVAMIFSFIYMGFLLLWGNPDLRVIALTYLGLALSLACYLSFGAFVSALCSSQAVAFVVNFIALLVLWLLQSLGQRMSAKWGPIEWGPVLTYASPLEHFSAFSEGVVHAKDIVYFITVITLMLFLTYKVIESNRWR